MMWLLLPQKKPKSTNSPAVLGKHFRKAAGGRAKNTYSAFSRPLCGKAYIIALVAAVGLALGAAFKAQFLRIGAHSRNANFN